MPKQPRPLPLTLPDVFDVRAAKSAGVTTRRLRHPSLEAPFRGARIASSEAVPGERSDVAVVARAWRDDIRRRARAYASVAPEHAFFCGVTAAVLHDLPLPLRVLHGVDSDSARLIDAAVHPPHRAPRAAGVRGRPLGPTLATVGDVRGLRVATVDATWAQLAVELTVDELIIVADALVYEPRLRGVVRGQPGSGKSTIPRLSALAATTRVGGATLREAVRNTRVGSASPPETVLRLAMLREGLPEPEPDLDVDVYDRSGVPIRFTELAYPRWRVLIEYEGDHHRVERAQWQRDVDKHAACVAAGWEVIRILAGHMRSDAAPAVARIHDALLRAGWRPGAA